MMPGQCSRWPGKLQPTRPSTSPVPGLFLAVRSSSLQSFLAFWVAVSVRRTSERQLQSELILEFSAVTLISGKHVSVQRLLLSAAGVASFTGQFRAHFEETGALMQSRSPLVKEAAAMLGFLDVGLGLSNMGLVLQLSRNILELVLKIDALGGALPAQPCNQ